ncbi:hypothetical protein GCT19_40460 [Paraburkholderia sp. CNPSo 3155]|nr:hypothetical protein [Paraburkholderia atlantica]NUY35889.1 hypothetical protein [Paraburkholderia atlantica]
MHRSRHVPQRPGSAPRAQRYQVAQLGGYLARASDPLPGNTVMWREMRRLTDIQLRYEVALKEVGNCKARATLTAFLSKCASSQLMRRERFKAKLIKSTGHVAQAL